MARDKGKRDNIFWQKLRTFYRNQAGVYSVMTALLSFALIGYIAFVVDGTGMLLDRARLNQGVEQAGLFLTNTKDEAHLTSQDSKIRKQNKELISKIAGTYYQPNMMKEKIDAEFEYRCRFSREMGTIACNVGGYFNRPTWLYLGKAYQNTYSTTFNREEKVVSNDIRFLKRVSYPMDIMFVVNLSSSMPAYVDYHIKIYVIKQTLRRLVKELLWESKRNFNRVGVMGYSWGVALLSDDGRNHSCYFPYAKEGIQFGLKGERKNISITDYDNLKKYLEAVVKDLRNDNNQPEATERLSESLDYFEKNVTHPQYAHLGRRPDYTKPEYCLAWWGDYGHGNHRNIKSSFYWAGANKKDRDELDLFLDWLQVDSRYSRGITAGGLMNAGRIMAKDLNPAGRTTQRKIIIISDDGLGIGNKRNESDDLGFTATLIKKHRLCERITHLLDQSQNEANNIYYVAIGALDPKKEKSTWEPCTGKDNAVAIQNNGNALYQVLKKFTNPKTSSEWQVMEAPVN